MSKRTRILVVLLLTFGAMEFAVAANIGGDKLHAGRVATRPADGAMGKAARPASLSVGPDRSAWTPTQSQGRAVPSSAGGRPLLAPPLAIPWAHAPPPATPGFINVKAGATIPPPVLRITSPRQPTPTAIPTSTTAETPFATASVTLTRWNDLTSENAGANLAAVNAITATPTATASPFPAGAIAGKVTDKNGTALALGYVWALFNGGSQWVGPATTAADGAYTLAGLTPGDYRVYAQASGYASAYYNGTYDYNAATLVHITSGTTTASIDFALTLGGSITGKVTDTGGTPIAGASVQAFTSSCCGYGSATTAGDGTYLITGLVLGSYRVQASGPYCPAVVTSPPCVGYASQYYDHTFDYSSATLVATTSGGTTPNINFALAPGASISGKVINALGTPVAGAWVSADRNVGAGGGGWATTAADGTYLMTNLAPGSDVVGASVPSCPVVSPPASPPPAGGPCTPYPTWFYNGTCEYVAATPVPVISGGSATNINITLRQANPDCVDHALAIVSLPFTDTRSTAGATTAPGENLPCGMMGATVWYDYTAPPSPASSNTTGVDTLGSTFNTAVAVYSQGVSPPGVLTLIGCKASGSGSLVNFIASPGTRYYFQIGGQQAASGQLVINVFTAGVSVPCSATDLDHNGKVGFPDLYTVALAYNSTSSTTTWNQAADFNHDGKVGFDDLYALALNYNKVC